MCAHTRARVCVCVRVREGAHAGQKRNNTSLRGRVMGIYELPDVGCWDPKSGPLIGQ